MVSLASLALSASERAIRIADRYANWRNLGGDFITQVRVTKSSSTLTESNDANASRKTSEESPEYNVFVLEGPQLRPPISLATTVSLSD